MSLRDGRGRIRCYISDIRCATWADRWVWMPTEWSVMAQVPVCDVCLGPEESPLTPLEIP